MGPRHNMDQTCDTKRKGHFRSIYFGRVTKGSSPWGVFWLEACERLNLGLLEAMQLQPRVLQGLALVAQKCGDDASDTLTPD